MIRKAQFADSWYPGNPDKLEALLKKYITDDVAEKSAVGLIAPHAGYVYSGPVAGAVYRQVHIPDTVVILCVNHRGLGEMAALFPAGTWETPLGPVNIQEDFSQALKNKVSFLEEDAVAHASEHSLEMQVPFLQYRNPAVQVVPICLQQLSLAACEELGQGLAEAIQEFPEEVLLVASSDMTHFETQEKAKAQDRLAIDRILAVDPKGLYETVRKHRISMCGVIPTTVVLSACQALNVPRGILAEYATSGDVSGDYANVVGYAGIFLEKSALPS